jgi:phage-related minor tail protein
MVNEVVQIEVREDGSQAVASKFNTMADAGDRASNSNDALQKILNQVSTTMGKVAQSVDRLNSTLSQQATTTAKVAQAAAQAATASNAQSVAATALAESEAEAAARIASVVTASLAQVAASNSSSAALRGAAQASQEAGQASVAAGQAAIAQAQAYTATAQAATRQIQSVEALSDAVGSQIKTIEQWRTVEGQLVDAQQRGVISAGQYRSMLAQLDAQLPNLTASIDKERAAVAGLTASYDPLSAKMSKLEKDEQTLTALRAKGMVTLEQYNKLMQSISAQKLVVANASEATEELSKFGESSAGAKREFGVLIGELARGNFAALQGSAITLSNRMGLLEKAFSATGVAIGLTVAALAVVGIAMVAGYLQAQNLANALNLAGNSSGITAGQVNTLAKSLNDSAANTATNLELLTALAATGQVTGQSLTSVGTAASNAMKLTGESVDQVVQSFQPLYTDPVKWAEDMDTKWHFLNIDTLDHIKHLQDTGDTYGAVQAAAIAYADATDPRVKNMIDNAGILERTWRSVGNYLATVKQFYADIDKPPAVMDAFAKAKQDYSDWQAAVKKGNTDIYDPKNNEVLAYGTTLWNKLHDAQQLVIGQKNLAAADAAADQQRKASLDAGKGIDSVNDKTQKQINLQNQLTKLKADYIQLNKTDPTNSRLAGVSFGANGDPSGGAYASKVAELNTQANGKPKTGPVDHSAEQAARELAQQEDAFDRLRDTIDPTRGALDQMAKSQELYTVAVKNGWIEQNQADFEMAQYQIKLQDTINPLAALNTKLDQQIDGFNKVSTVSKAAASVEKDRQDLLQKGIVLTDADAAALDTKYEAINKGLAQQAIVDKVTKAAMTQTMEQIDQLKILNDAQTAGQLTKQQVGDFEVKQNPDIFKGTQVAQDQQLKQQQQYYDLVDQMRQQDLISESDAAKAKQNIDASVQNIRLQGTMNFLSSLAQMSRSSNRTQAGIGKAAAIAEASINTYKSATASYASLAGIPFVGPILGAIAAAAAVASGLAQIQQIRSVNTTGYQSGGYTGDGAQNAVAGQVHGQEFVSNAATTARYRSTLEAMHNGTYNENAPNAGNSGQSPSVNVQQGPTRVVVVRDNDDLKNYMQGEDGERVIVAHMQNNKDLLVS